jgi:hypothetical protein
MFFTGLGVLFIGIIVGVAIITFIGLGLIAAVILGWIIDNYLVPVAGGTWFRENARIRALTTLGGRPCRSAAQQAAGSGSRARR